MSTLLFLLTVLSLFVFFIILLVKALRRKPVAKTFYKILAIVLVYAVLWAMFYFKAADVQVPLGTDVCFDDWCATGIRAEIVNHIGDKTNAVYPHGKFVILYITMSNHARGIAQKPSEPRIHIIDDKGNSWAYSPEAQKALESSVGQQPGLDARLELHQSLQTQLVFDIPKDAINPKALIEEGPFITKLLLADDQEVFEIE